MLKRRRCTSLTTVAEHSGAMSSTIQKWSSKRLAVYQTAGWRSFCPPPPGCYVLQEDGAKIGQLAVETQTYIMQHVASDQSMVLPPQVLRMLFHLKGKTPSPISLCAQQNQDIELDTGVVNPLSFGKTLAQ